MAFWVGGFIFGLNIVMFLLGIARHEQFGAPHERASSQNSVAKLLGTRFARHVSAREFSIQSLNAYFAFYIVIVMLRYLHLPDHMVGVAVAAQGLAFVLALVTAGKPLLLHPCAGRVLGGCLVVAALLGLALSFAAVEIYLYASLLGIGLGVLQVLNLADFARLGESIGFNQAASINALAGPSGGVIGGLLGGLLERWITPQLLFLAFIPVFIYLTMARQYVESE